MDRDGEHNRARPLRRVALVPESYVFGGMEIHVLQLLRRLDRSRYEPILVVPSEDTLYAAPPPRLVEGATASGATIVRAPDPGTSRLLAFPRDVRNLRRLLREHDIDIVHVHTSRPTRGRRITLAKLLSRTPAMVRTEHLPATVLQGTKLQQMVSRVFDRAVDRIVVVSEQNRRSQVEDFGRGPDKVTLIRNGIEIDRYVVEDVRAEARSRLGIDPASPVIGAVGRLAEQKAIDVLIRATADVVAKYPSAVLLLVGDGPLEDELRALADSLGIARNVRFEGFQSDPTPYVQAMDIATMPSRFEGLPLALLEYMAMGKACVVSDFASLLEVVEDGTSGIIVPVDDAAALGASLAELLGDPDRIAALGRGARQQVEAAFSISRQVDELMDVYDQALR